VPLELAFNRLGFEDGVTRLLRSSRTTSFGFGGLLLTLAAPAMTAIAVTNSFAVMRSGVFTGASVISLRLFERKNSLWTVKSRRAGKFNWGDKAFVAQSLTLRAFP